MEDGCRNSKRTLKFLESEVDSYIIPERLKANLRGHLRRLQVALGAAKNFRNGMDATPRPRRIVHRRVHMRRLGRQSENARALGVRRELGSVHRLLHKHADGKHAARWPLPAQGC